MKYYEQGDVLLIPCKDIKGDKIKSKKYVLAEGEVTGHSHVITEIEKSELYMKDGEMYLKVLSPVHIEHEEHAKILVQPGNYKVNIVKEYDYFEKQKRKVQD